MKKDKQKDIARSVLPAGRNRARTARYDLETERRRSRRSTRQKLHIASQYNDIDDCELDFNAWPNARINDIKAERQLGDKLGALMRWAQHHGSKIGDPDDAYYWIKSILGDNLAGRHALSHAKDVDALTIDYEHERYGFNRKKHEALIEQHMRQREAVRSALGQALANAAHHSINAIIHEAEFFDTDVDSLGYSRQVRCKCMNTKMFLDRDNLDEFIEYWYGKMFVGKYGYLRTFFPHRNHREPVNKLINDFLSYYKWL